MKNNKFFIGTILVSIILHIFFLKVDTNMFELKESGIMIPVNLIPEHLMKEKIPEIKKQQIEPKLPPKGDGVYLRKATLSELASRYTSFIVYEIIKRKFSPSESKYFRLIGNVRVGFTIGPYGRFTNVRVVSSSGNELLDNTGVNAVKATSGVVKRPAWSGRNKLRVSVVIKYQYRL